MSSAYLIMNTRDALDGYIDITPVSLWSNFQAALDELANIAKSEGVEVDELNEIWLPTDGTRYDAIYYYIAEMELH